MAEQVVSPDLSFVKDVIASGGGDLKKCYQCSTCTVVCNVTPDNKPFPRKEMLYAQWGMKDRLISNPDIWLCHQCSDCTAHCPRGAKPGEVLGAVRKMAIKHYSGPSTLANMTADPKYLLLLFAIPAVLFFAIIASLGHLDVSSIKPAEHGGISFSNFIPVKFIDSIFIPVAGFAALAFVFGIRKYWADLVKNGGSLAKMDLFSSLYLAIIDIVTHKKFTECDVANGRTASHRAVFFSFIGLAITTALGVFYLYGLKWESPYPLSDPLKIIGNISAIALLAGIIAVASNRIDNQEKAGKGGYFDWLFIGVVFGVGGTGFLSEILRLSNVAAIAFCMYYLHLVFIFFLFAYAPFSKMAHMVYRATAMVYARHTGRE